MDIFESGVWILEYAAASDILAQVSEDGEHWRLLYGAAKRTKMLEVINKKGVPTDYRYKFLNEKAKAIMPYLIKFAVDFNKQHPNDLCSVDDLIDILGTAQHLLTKKSI